MCGWMHGKSLAHAAVMGYQGMRGMVARGELIGVGVLVVIVDLRENYATLVTSAVELGPELPVDGED